MAQALRDALVERLVASDDDFRKMRNRVREAGALLMALGAIRIVVSLYIFSSSYDSMDETTTLLALLVAVDVLVGIAMIVASRFVERRPRRVAWSVLVGWIVLQLLMAAAAPMSFLLRFAGKLFITAVLIRIVFAAGAAEELRARLTRKPAGWAAAQRHRRHSTAYRLHASALTVSQQKNLPALPGFLFNPLRPQSYANAAFL